MKKKYAIELHSSANTTLIEAICVMIAIHNGGKDNLDLVVLEGYFKGHCVRMDYPEAFTVKELSDGKLSLFMKPEQPFLTIQEKIVHELVNENLN